MIFLCCDSNVYVRMLTQARPGCEPQHFEDLKALVQEGVARLLIPEMVLLELEKHRSAFPGLFKSRIEEYKKAVVPKNLWNEIEDVGRSVLDLLDKKLEEKTSRFTQGHDALREWFTAPEPTILPFTSEILFQAKRRLISGQMPRPENKAENDACIIESLLSFFKDHGVEGHVLYFCTENYHDFAVELPVQLRARRFVLHPMLQPGLPSTNVFPDLGTMMAFAKGYESFPEPTTEEVKKAVEAFGATARSEEEEETLRRLLDRVSRDDSDRALLQATLHHMESQPEYVRAVWESLANEAVSLLRQCRACRSWDEKSEGKLPQWLELEEPDMVPFVSLPKLVRIKRNLEEYLRVHTQMDQKLEQEGAV